MARSAALPLGGGDATGKVVSGEVRTPDARTPLVRGAGLWRCETAGSGDLTVRAPGRGRFLLGAAVNPDHLAVAGYWSTRCSLR